MQWHTWQARGQVKDAARSPQLLALMLNTLVFDAQSIACHFHACFWVCVAASL
jgi:hypothetical protein